MIEIAEDPTIDRIWLTNWIAENSTSNLQGLDQYGMVFTDDGGSSFEQRLHGQKILLLVSSRVMSGQQVKMVYSDPKIREQAGK